MKLLRGLRALFGGWILLFGCVAAMILVLPFLRKKSRHRFFGLVAHFFGRACLWLCGVRLVLENPSPLTGRDARVMVINHQSILDIAIGASLLPEGVIIIAKKEIAYVPLLNLVWWLMGFIFVDRKNSEKAQAAVAEIPQKIISGNRTLLVAPEGTRSATGALLPFKMGAFHMAQQAGVPIYPVVFDGAYAAWPKGDFLPSRGGVVRMRYLDPVDTTHWRADTVKEEAAKIRDDMQAVLDGWRSGT